MKCPGTIFTAVDAALGAPRSARLAQSAGRRRVCDPAAVAQCSPAALLPPGLQGVARGIEQDVAASSTDEPWQDYRVHVKHSRRFLMASPGSLLYPLIPGNSTKQATHLSRPAGPQMSWQRWPAQSWPCLVALG